MPYTLIMIVVLAFVIVAAILAVTRRIKTCPSDQILVKFGLIGGSQSAKTIHGGTTFIWPVVQGYRFLDRNQSAAGAFESVAAHGRDLEAHGS